MAKRDINIGAEGNDGTGDSIRESFRKVNNNFTELYAVFGLGGDISFTTLNDTPTLDQLANTPSELNSPALVGVNVGAQGSAIEFFKLVSNGFVTGNANDDTVTFDLTSDGSIIVRAVKSDISTDTSPTLGGNLDLAGNFIVANPAPEQEWLSKIQELQSRPGAATDNITIDDILITKGYADRNYLKSSGSSAGARVRVRTEDTISVEDYTYSISEVTNGNLVIAQHTVGGVVAAGHGLDTSANGAEFVYRTTGTSAQDADSNLLTDTSVYPESKFYIRVEDTNQLSLHTSLENAQSGEDKVIVSGGTDHSIVDYYYRPTQLTGDFLANEALPREAVVRRQGDTMEGPLYLDDHPGELAGAGTPNGEEDLQAATKFYVDNTSFNSNVNLYVSLSGNDRQTSTPLGKEGRALSYAYRTVNAASERAEQIIQTSPLEAGPYRQTIEHGATSDLLTPSTVVIAEFISPAEYGGAGTAFTSEFNTVAKSNLGLVIDSTIEWAEQQELAIDYDYYRKNLRHVLESARLDAVSGETANKLSRQTGQRYYADPQGLAAAITNRAKTLAVINQAKSLYASVFSSNAILQDAVDSFEDNINIVIGIIQNGYNSAPALIDGSTYIIRISNGGEGTVWQGQLTNNDLIPGKIVLGKNSQSAGTIVKYTIQDEIVNVEGNDINVNSIELKLEEPAEFLAQGQVQTLQNTSILLEIGEELEFGNRVNNNNITIFVESGIFYEDYPIRVPANVSIKGDEFRRTHIRPRNRVSQSTWANTYFYRDSEFDDLVLHDNIVSFEDEFVVTLTSAITVNVGDVITQENNPDVIAVVQIKAINSNTITVTYDDGFVPEGTNTSPSADFNDADIILVNGISSGATPVDVAVSERTFNMGWHYAKNSRTPVNTNAQLAANNPGNYLIAAETIEENKQSIQDDVIAWINIQDPLLDYDQDKCYRDVGYIVDAIVQDLRVGSNENTLEAQGRYYEGAVEAGQESITRDAIGQIAVIANLLLVDAEVNSGTTVNNLVDLVAFAFDSDYNPPLHNRELDVFLMNDATILRNLTVQGHGGFMCVLDAEGQILTKSPYIQTGSSFSQSANKQAFRGGMFVDGFVGNMPIEIVSQVNGDAFRVYARSKKDSNGVGHGLFARRPQMPAPFYVQGVRYQINAIANHDLQQGTCELILSSNSGNGSGWVQSDKFPVMLQTAGNRSMLGNDFTQINDLGYGLLTTNNALSEMVSMFTYYCHAGYYANNGSEIRSLNGSNAYGNFGLVAGGSDPNEAAQSGTLAYNTVQTAKVYVNPSLAAVAEQLQNFIYVYDTDFIPLPEGEIEITFTEKKEVTGFTAPNQVDIIGHGYANGQKIVIDSTSGITGLNDTHYVQVVNLNAIALYADQELVSARNLTGTFGSNGSAYPADGEGTRVTRYEVVSVQPSLQTEELPGVNQLTLSLSGDVIANYGDTVVQETTGATAVVVEPQQTRNSVGTVVGGNTVIVTQSDTAGAFNTSNAISITSVETNQLTTEFSDNIIVAGIADDDVSGLALGGANGAVWRLGFSANSANTEISTGGLAEQLFGGESVIIRARAKFILNGVDTVPVRPSTAVVFDESPITYRSINFDNTSITDFQGASATSELPAGQNLLTFDSNYRYIQLPVTYDNYDAQVRLVLASSTAGVEPGTVIVQQTTGAGATVSAVISTSELVLTDWNGIDFNTVNELLVDSVSLGASSVPQTVYHFSDTATFGATTGDVLIATSAVTSPDTLSRLSNSDMIFAWKNRVHVVIAYHDGEGNATGSPSGSSLATGFPYIEIAAAALIDKSSVAANGIEYPVRVDYEKDSTVLSIGVQSGEGADITVNISLCRATGHDFSNIGTGGFNTTNYPNVIFGAPTESKTSVISNDDTIDKAQVWERNKGRVFFASTDEDGFFRVGKFFTVDQGTGRVSFAAQIAISNLDGLGFRDGEIINKFSSDTAMFQESNQSVPTESAVVGYVDRRLGYDKNMGQVQNKIGDGFLAQLNPVLTQSADGNLTHTLNVAQGRIELLADPDSQQDATNRRYVDNRVFANDSIQSSSDVELNNVDFAGNYGANSLIVMTGNKRVYVSSQGAGFAVNDIVASTTNKIAATIVDLEFKTLDNDKNVQVVTHQPIQLTSILFNTVLSTQPLAGDVVLQNSTQASGTVIRNQSSSATDFREILVHNVSGTFDVSASAESFTIVKQGLPDVPLTAQIIAVNQLAVVDFQFETIEVVLGTAPGTTRTTTAGEDGIPVTSKLEFANATQANDNAQHGAPGSITRSDINVVVNRTAEKTEVNLQLQESSVVNADVNTLADVAQSKLKLNPANILANSDSFEDGSVAGQRARQSKQGVAAFNAGVFAEHQVWTLSGSISVTVGTKLTQGSSVAYVTKIINATTVKVRTADVFVAGAGELTAVPISVIDYTEGAAANTGVTIDTILSTGYVDVKDYGITYDKLQQLPANTVLGRTSTAGRMQAVPFDDVVTSNSIVQSAIKDSDFTTVAEVPGAALTKVGEGVYRTTNITATGASSSLVKTLASGATVGNVNPTLNLAGWINVKGLIVDNVRVLDTVSSKLSVYTPGDHLSITAEGAAPTAGNPDTSRVIIPTASLTVGSINVAKTAIGGDYNGFASNFQQNAENNNVAQAQPYIVSPWVYTNFVQATDDLSDTGTGIAIGGYSTFTSNDEIALIVNGDAGVQVAYDEISLATGGNTRVVVGNTTTQISNNLAVSGSAVLQDGLTVSGGVVGVSINMLTDGYADSTNVGLGNNSLLSVTTGTNNTAVGADTLRNATSDSYNTAVGPRALSSQTGAAFNGNNTAVGAFSLLSNTTGHNNTAQGRASLYSNTTGIDNTAVGLSSLFSNTTGSDNTAQGAQSLYSNTTGSDNTAQGRDSLKSNTTGRCNTAQGRDSLKSNTTGSYNTAVGTCSLCSNTTGSRNTAIGRNSGCTLTSGNNNSFLGHNAQPSTTTASNEITLGDNNVNVLRVPGLGSTNGYALVYSAAAGGYVQGEVKTDLGQSRTSTSYTVTSSTGSNTTLAAATTSLSGVMTASDKDKLNSAVTSVSINMLTDGYADATNVALGARSLRANTTGCRNTAQGYQSLESNTTGNFNTTTGAGSLQSNTSGSWNSAHGYWSLRDNTTSSWNTAQGAWSLLSNTTGSCNTAQGGCSLCSNTTGSYNTAQGRDSLRSNTTGSCNTAQGRFSLESNTSGRDNTAQGERSLRNSTTGSCNTAVGHFSLWANTTGSYNTAVGAFGLESNVGGCKNTAIGYGAGYNSVSGCNNSFLGQNAQPSNSFVSDQITLGNRYITNLRCNDTSISSLSDERDKDNIQDISWGIEYIEALRPVKFEWNRRDGSMRGKKDVGFIAQQLDQVEAEFDSHEHTRLVHKDDPDKWEADPMKTYPILVKAVQELSASARQGSEYISVSETTENLEFYPTFANSAGGSQSIFADTASFSYNPSANVLTVGSINGTTSSARADLAERYVANAPLEPGTVVVFGGPAEVAECTKLGDFRVAGVVSTAPAHLMNAQLTGKNVIDVALQGRVPCKVIGKVEKGDMLVTSAVPGYAVVNNSPAVGTVIGKAVGTKFDSGRGTVEVVVGKG